MHNCASARAGHEPPLAAPERMLRARVWVPLPHVASHGLQELHAVTMQLTGQGCKDEKISFVK